MTTYTYKIVNADQLDADMKVVADAIRAKGGTTEELAFPNGMKAAVEAISSGGSADAYYKIPSGKYNLTTIWDDSSSYTIDGWSREALVGKFTDQYSNYVKQPFDHMRCEEYYLYFEKSGDDVCGINPGYGGSDYYAQIDLASDQFVSEGFKGWWDRHAVYIGESEGSSGDSGSGDSTGGDGEITQVYMKAGTYNITKSYPDSYASIPSGAYETTANVSGSVWYAGGEMGTFDSIKLSNNGNGEPYVTVGFYSNGSLLVPWRYTDDWDGFAFNITSDALVPILFYLIASEMFTKQ